MQYAVSEKKKSNLSTLALLRIVAEDYIDYYALGGARRDAVAEPPKLPAEEIAELIGDHAEKIEQQVAEVTLAPVVSIASHPAFDFSHWNQSPTPRRPEQDEPDEPRPELGEVRAIRA